MFLNFLKLFEEVPEPFFVCAIGSLKYMLFYSSCGNADGDRHISATLMLTRQINARIWFSCVDRITCPKIYNNKKPNPKREKERIRERLQGAVVAPLTCRQGLGLPCLLPSESGQPRRYGVAQSRPDLAWGCACHAHSRWHDPNRWSLRLPKLGSYFLFSKYFYNIYFVLYYSINVVLENSIQKLELINIKSI